MPASISPDGEIFAGLAMAAHAHRMVGRLVPRVPRRAAVLPGLEVLVVIGQHGEGRDDVLLEILVLVVAPHHDQIGLELVDRAARLGEMRAVDLAAARGGRGAPIVAEFLAQRRRPVRRVFHLLGHRRVVERRPHHKGPVLVRPQHQRPVRAAHPQDLGHPVPPSAEYVIYAKGARPQQWTRR